jgi:Ca-activated chloride channel family protein
MVGRALGISSSSRSKAVAALVLAALLARRAATSGAAEDKGTWPLYRGRHAGVRRIRLDGRQSQSRHRHDDSADQRSAPALAKVLPSITRFRRVGLITLRARAVSAMQRPASSSPRPMRRLSLCQEVNALNPAGKTPTAAVEQAAEVLDYQKKPGLIVVLTDGEETCGGAPCSLGKMLHANAVQLTVHIIGFRMKDFSWTGEQSITDAKCLAEQNGGLYINADAEQDLIEALEKTLGCPMLSEALP